MKVHMILMPFSLPRGRDYGLVEKSIRAATTKDVIVFAPASTKGVACREFPATRRDVVCVHACDGFGNKAWFDPDFKEIGNNFACLGLGVVCQRDGVEVIKSGADYAAAVAVAVAANLLTASKHSCNIGEHEYKSLCSHMGISELFSHLFPLKGKYRVVLPTGDLGFMKKFDRAVRNIVGGE